MFHHYIRITNKNLFIFDANIMKNNTNPILKDSFTNFIAVAFMILVSISSFAQSDAKFTVRFKLIIKSGDMSNAQITITKNGTPYKVITPESGYRNIDLEFDGDYIFSCTKMGYIAKDVAYDTHIPAGREAEEFPKFESVVELWPQPSGAVVTFSQPVGKIHYDSKSDNFGYDKDYTNSALEMQKKATEHPVPKPKPPTPPPPPPPSPPPPPPPKVVSKPIPVEVKQTEYKPDPPKPKPVVAETATPIKKMEKEIVVRVVQEDRKKTTIVEVTVLGKNKYEYKKEEFAWGGIYFYKDGFNISDRTFEKETEKE